MSIGILQSIAMVVALAMVVAAAVVFAGLLAGVGPDRYRQITPRQFTIAVLTILSGFVTLAVLIALS